ncbi:NAD(P)-dependent dehydrogenase (short-subunit alcohol dehydrogenase family) [Novosphingobium hassiacum]|uniref:NAD(P)-dependent dehydrogenase (Short-subunit alcohol dehydrogenase family) n=1 Tax=Novosphingobium hassiacum TaxID=173676 RepID=A0A7W6EWE7_9SPHN|nr:SDR family oxidoreductase [Novosphingobium hassiacum]MBB3860915.1 NAD(P)-dependent dehydrogenase (short-subunit alcohol dehydrogenase family) [Novosphingobium hassiacum]
MDLQLSGRRALVTGASDGIGASTARFLAAEGATVAVHGRSAEKVAAVVASIVADGGVAHPVTGDVGIEADVEAVAKAASSALGAVDILVCNAGGRARAEPGYADTTADDYRASFQLNAGYSAQLINRLAPAMREQGYGRIILVASAAATQPMGHQPDYGMAKAAMVNLAVSTSKWLRGCGVTVNAISPGAVLTSQLRDYLERTGLRKGWPADWETIEKTAAETMLKIPVGRVGRVEEIASMIAYLASPWAGFVNGANIHVDGGVIGTMT